MYKILSNKFSEHSNLLSENNNLSLSPVRQIIISEFKEPIPNE